MARATKPDVPTKVSNDLLYATEVNALDAAIDEIIDDYVSQSEERFEGEFSGSSPITIPHGLGSTPSFVSVTPKALQPYMVAYNADDTNITVYHSAAGSLIVSVIAGV